MKQIIRLTENDIHNIVSHCLNRLINENLEGQEININGDLGLPSGTIWMEQNVGAHSPSDYGKFFAYGTQDGFYQDEVDNKIFSAKWYKQQELVDYNGYTFEDGSHAPSKEQIFELFKNVKAEKINHHGTSCALLTSKINGNSIILPFCGFIYNMSRSKAPEKHNQDTRSYFWTSTLHNKNNGNVGFVDTILGSANNLDCRGWALPLYYGIPIRGVK